MKLSKAAMPLAAAAAAATGPSQRGWMDGWIFVVKSTASGELCQGC